MRLRRRKGFVKRDWLVFKTRFKNTRAADEDRRFFWRARRQPFSTDAWLAFGSHKSVHQSLPSIRFWDHGPAGTAKEERLVDYFAEARVVNTDCSS